MKVLHVLRQLETGGIECWLNRLVSKWPSADNTEFHFALELEDPGRLATSFLGNGAKIHTLSHPANALLYCWRFFQLLRKNGPFAAIHCHNHKAAFLPLMLATFFGIPVRVSHAHADFRQKRVSAMRRIYEGISSRLVYRFSTVRLAVSQGAAEDLFPGRTTDFEWLPCGLDLTSMVSSTPRSEPECFTLIHVGRLVPEKNHDFLFQVFSKLHRVLPKSRLWIVGDGPERTRLEELAIKLGLANAIVFWGQRENVAEILSSADVFVFPSRTEGLGISAIEAQLLGVPVVVASHLPKELDAVPELCRRLAIDLPVEQWVNTIMQIRDSRSDRSNHPRVTLVNSPYSLDFNIHRLKGIYAR